MGIGKILPII